MIIDIVMRLRGLAPVLRMVDDNTFEISRDDIKALLQARTEAAKEIERLRAELQFCIEREHGAP